MGSGCRRQGPEPTPPSRACGMHPAVRRMILLPAGRARPVRPQRHRAHVWTRQGLPPHRHPLRPIGHKLPCCSLPRRHRQLLVMSLILTLFPRRAERADCYIEMDSVLALPEALVQRDRGVVTNICLNKDRPRAVCARDLAQSLDQPRRDPTASMRGDDGEIVEVDLALSLIHISEPTRQAEISY